MAKTKTHRLPKNRGLLRGGMTEEQVRRAATILFQIGEQYGRVLAELLEKNRRLVKVIERLEERLDRKAGREL